MDLEKLREIALKLPHVTEDVKWGHDLCFSIGDKMFLVAGLTESPTSASFKVGDDEFEKLSGKKGFKPAPYLARYKWIFVEDINFISEKEWEKVTPFSLEQEG